MLRMGKIVFRFESVGSTNDVAKTLAKKGLPEGTVVIAKMQEQGRGRRNKKWISPSGGLWFSVILRRKISPSCMPLIPLAAGVSIARTIRRLYQIDVALKWPNDVMAGTRKIAGILTETSSTIDDCYAVVGFGINVNNSYKSMPTQLRNEMISLYDLLGSEVNIDQLMQESLKEFSQVYAKILTNNLGDVVRDWKMLTNMLGQPILVYEDKAPFEASALDLESDGALLIQTKDGALRRLHSGNISIRRVEV
jgi:BirA family biotin operon repressor/biotin-[acetyl-CoA-carboxylase] ligase